MNIQTVEQKIIQVAESFLNEEYDNQYFIVSNDLSADKLVRIYIDGIEGVSFQVCRRLSRHIESHLDEELWLGEKYKLEVSSPGIDRPLTDPRQFKKHVGRKVEVKELSGNVQDGKLIEVTASTLSLETKNKKQIKLQLTNVENMKIEISFKK